MAIAYKGKKIETLSYKGKNIESLYYKGKKIFSSFVAPGTVIYSGSQAFGGVYSSGTLAGGNGPVLLVELKKIKNGIKIYLTAYVLVDFAVNSDNTGVNPHTVSGAHSLNTETSNMVASFAGQSMPIKIAKTALENNANYLMLTMPFASDKYASIHKDQTGKVYVQYNGKNLNFSYTPNTTSSLTVADSWKLTPGGTLFTGINRNYCYFIVDKVEAY